MKYLYKQLLYRILNVETKVRIKSHGVPFSLYRIAHFSLMILFCLKENSPMSCIARVFFNQLTIYYIITPYKVTLKSH